MQDPEGPLVSIIIPTLNECEDLPTCLSAIKVQSHPRFEVLVVDSGSQDGTREAAAGAGAWIVDYPGRPLGARLEGLEHSHGDLVMLLDADQVLFPDSLERAVASIEGVDMLILEESSYRPKGFLQMSIARQKQALQEGVGQGRIPAHAYPRFFRREVLEAAYSLLPQDKLGEVFAYDDRILFSKASKVSSRTAFLSRGVMHIEESRWMDLMRHSYRLGRSAKAMEALGLEEEAKAPESALTMFKRSVRNRYLAYSIVKEACFKIGRLRG